MGDLALRLMDYHSKGAQVKVIDFSEVPAEILPTIVGLVARIVYQIQFWTDRDKRRPLAFICDEAHLYLPKRKGLIRLSSALSRLLKRLRRKVVNTALPF